MNPNKLFFALLFLFFSFSFSIFAQTSKVKSAEVKFSAETRFGNVNGLFKTVKITSLDPKNNTATVEIDTSSIFTDNGMRDKHLQSDEFFDVAQFPKAIFQLESLTKDSEESFTAKGKLTIKNISKELSFPVNLIKADNISTYSGTVKVNRRDFQMNYNNFINPIKDTITITIQAGIESK